MEIQQDFKELLQFFNEENVKYIIVGGYALAFHGFPRFTGDIDLWVEASKENAQHILQALEKFGFSSIELKLSDFTQDENIIQLGYPPARIDLMTAIDGVNFAEAFPNRIPTSYGDVEVFMISRDDFIQNKRATGRYKDLADLESLGES